MSAQHRPLVVDTCCLINLLSAQPPILSHNTHPLHLGFSLSLSERVVGDECLYICEPPKPGAPQKKIIRRVVKKPPGAPETQKP